jgi:hypothetical protein
VDVGRAAAATRAVDAAAATTTAVQPTTTAAATIVTGASRAADTPATLRRIQRPLRVELERSLCGIQNRLHA